MDIDDIRHLGDMARISLSDEEAKRLNGEIEQILDYVSAVNEITADYSTLTKTVGPVHNVFREDEVTNAPGAHTKELVDAFPEKDGAYLSVKKILNTDTE